MQPCMSGGMVMLIQLPYNQRVTACYGSSHGACNSSDHLQASAGPTLACRGPSQPASHIAWLRCKSLTGISAPTKTLHEQGPAGDL